jgi:hypothetical protein
VTLFNHQPHPPDSAPSKRHIIDVNVNGNVPEANDPNGFGYVHVYEHEHVNVASLKSSPEWEVLRPI